MNAAGYKQDYRKTDLVLFLGLVSIAVTLLAQFYPGKWPANYYLSVRELGCCRCPLDTIYCGAAV